MEIQEEIIIRNSEGKRVIPHSTFAGKSYWAVFIDIDNGDEPVTIVAKLQNAVCVEVVYFKSSPCFARFEADNVELQLAPNLSQRTLIIFCKQLPEGFSDQETKPCLPRMAEASYRIVYNPFKGIVRQAIQDEMMSLLLYTTEENTSQNQHPAFSEREMAAIIAAGKTLDNHSLVEAFDLLKLSKASGLNRYRFLELFMEIFGCTPRNYLHERRMQEGQHLLATTHHNINEIALECGYAQASTFSYNFTRRFGLCPTRWRKQCKK